jgi:hypothetical protein
VELEVHLSFTHLARWIRISYQLDEAHTFERIFSTSITSPDLFLKLVTLSG